MSTPSTDVTALTRAQKRKITVADAEEKPRQAQKAFEVEAKVSGGRRAKFEANKNADECRLLWKVDQPKSRKRTSSTVEVSDKAKKPRKAASGMVLLIFFELARLNSIQVQSDAEEDIPEAKAKTSTMKRTPAHMIMQSTLVLAAPVKFPKSKSAGKVKQVAGKATAPTANSSQAPDTAKPKVSTKSKLPPAKIIADSASDVEVFSNEGEGSDSDMDDFEDANEAEFLIEVPHVVSKKAAAASGNDSDLEQGSDMEMTDSVSGAGLLFDTDQESIEIDKPRGKRSEVESASDDELSDAPPRRAVPEGDDVALHEAIADELVDSKSCQPEAGSSATLINLVEVEDSD
ncbi:hypothetical protein B0H19DRAFT_1064599 [Mycena capillaripes]|nr:hypothetical protein B0H19DRAFT_1064599 [Mycena capillaripes]